MTSPCKHPQSLHVVGMFVRDHHACKLTALNPHFIESLLNSFIADSGIDENVRLLRTDIDAISATATGYTR